MTIQSSASLLLASKFCIVEMGDEYLRSGLIERSRAIGRHLVVVLPENTNDPAAKGVRHLRESLERVLTTGGSDAMPVQKYDIPNLAFASGFEERWWKPSCSPVFGVDGRIVFILHSVIDVTDSAKLNRIKADSAYQFFNHSFLT